MVDKVKKGEPLYGKSQLTEYMQGVASRQSRYAGLWIHVMPWFNLVNHNQVRRPSPTLSHDLSLFPLFLLFPSPSTSKRHTPADMSQSRSTVSTLPSTTSKQRGSLRPRRHCHRHCLPLHTIEVVLFAFHLSISSLLMSIKTFHRRSNDKTLKQTNPSLFPLTIFSIQFKHEKKRENPLFRRDMLGPSKSTFTNNNRWILHLCVNTYMLYTRRGVTFHCIINFLSFRHQT